MKRLICLISALVLCGSYITYALVRPLGALEPQLVYRFSREAQPVNLTWPSYGSSAVGAVGYDLLETHGADEPLPTASIIKVLTALLILNQKPLAKGEQGPMITIEQADVDSYNRFVASNGSVVRVSLGEQLSEYQALQALLIPSANNMAETLARWTFGSVETFNRYANEYAIKLGMNHTTVTDPSGLLATTISSPSDLVRLGLVAMDNTVVREIVSQSGATLPVQGYVRNYNSLLGTNGFVGIKTGNNDENKGSLLFATEQTVDNTPITIIGVVMGGPDLGTALHDSRMLAASVVGGFVSVPIIAKDTAVERYAVPWQPSVEAVAAQDYSTLIWNNSSLFASIKPRSLKSPIPSGRMVGTLVIHNSKQGTDVAVPLVLRKSLGAPTIWWRLTHPR